MGSDAVKDLREWQRREASTQERALRAAAKAQARLAQLDTQRADAEADLARALKQMAAAGISREQSAAFLGVSPATLTRPIGANITRRHARPGSAATPDAATTEPTRADVRPARDGRP